MDKMLSNTGFTKDDLVRILFRLQTLGKQGFLLQQKRFFVSSLAKRGGLLSATHKRHHVVDESFSPGE
jgi:hypothetical protein